MILGNNDVVDIRSYTFRSEDRLLLDTNIWLLVYGPNADSDDRRTKAYSAALRKMREHKAKIFTDELILSEFINRFARWEYGQLAPSTRPQYFKEFRKSPAFKQVAQEIAASAKMILKMTVCCDSGFDRMNVEQMLIEFETGNFDFNDQIIFELCKAKQFILVTDDGDFKTTDISILTVNRALLA
jgi:predicted nucleic acid-binding protein